jgi:hypothetical protein
MFESPFYFEESMTNFTFVLSDEQSEELRRCANSLVYFIETYVKIQHPVKGLIPVHLHDFQRRYLDALQTERFLLVPKFRQGGFTTFNAFHKLWKALYKPDQTILWVTKTDREAIETCLLVKQQIDNLPEWLVGGLRTKNDHHLHFDTTGSHFFFFTAEAAKGRAVTDLVIDEAAYFKDLDRYWQAVVPCIAMGGNATVVSTPKRLKKGEKNWFKDQLDNDKDSCDLVQWKVFHSSWHEHPEYDNEEWADKVRASLGEDNWRIEIEQEWVVDEDEPKHKPNVNLAPVEMKIIHRDVTNPVLVEAPKHKPVPPPPSDDGILKLDIQAETIDLTKTGLPDRAAIHQIIENIEKAAEKAGPVEHPKFLDEEGEAVCNDIDGIWNSIAEAMPETKQPQKPRSSFEVPFDYNNVGVDMLTMAGVMKEGEALPLDIDYKVEVIRRVTKGLPSQLKLDLDGSAITVNGVPTKINAKAVEMAILGLAELSTTDGAIDTVSRLVRRKLQRLF